MKSRVNHKPANTGAKATSLGSGRKSRERSYQHDYQNLSVVQSGSQEIRMAAALEVRELRVGVREIEMDHNNFKSNFSREKNMRRSLLIILVFLGLPGVAMAQEEGSSPLRAYLSYGNSFQGFPGGAGKHQFVTGGELVFWKGLGAGLELGTRGLSLNTPYSNQELTCTQSETSPGSGAPVFSCRESGGPGAFTLSANGSDNFPLGQFEPFVTAGYSLSAFKDNSTFHFVNYGGGINYWFDNSLGLRLEVRDHLSLRNAQAHFPEVRVGVIFDFH